MIIPKSKVYIRLNPLNYIVRVEGGYTTSYITDLENWIFIDEGYGDKYNLCQNNYFPKPILTHDGAYAYKFIDGEVVECTEEEIAEQVAAMVSEPVATQADRIEAQVLYTALMTDTLLETEG